MSHTSCSVLVVDDDDELRDTVTELLRLEGFDVSSASNGHEALEFLRSNPAPHVIVLDLMMPVMNGQQFRQAQLDAPAFAAIPVVLLTAVHNGRQQAEAMGVSDFFSKPVDFDVFIAALRTYC